MLIRLLLLAVSIDVLLGVAWFLYLSPGIFDLLGFQILAAVVFAKPALLVPVFRQRPWACTSLAVVYLLSFPILWGFAGMLHDWVLPSTVWWIQGIAAVPLAAGLLLLARKRAD